MKLTVKDIKSKIDALAGLVQSSSILEAFSCFRIDPSGNPAEPDFVWFSATDSGVVSRFKIPAEDAGDFKPFLIPAKHLRQLVSMLDAEAELSIDVLNKVVIRYGNSKSQFAINPDVDAFILDEGREEKATVTLTNVPVASLIYALRTCAPMAYKELTTPQFCGVALRFLPHGLLAEATDKNILARVQIMPLVSGSAAEPTTVVIPTSSANHVIKMLERSKDEYCTLLVLAGGVWVETENMNSRLPIIQLTNKGWPAFEPVFSRLDIAVVKFNLQMKDFSPAIKRAGLSTDVFNRNLKMCVNDGAVTISVQASTKDADENFEVTNLTHSFPLPFEIGLSQDALERIISVIDVDEVEVGVSINNMVIHFRFGNTRLSATCPSMV